MNKALPLQGTFHSLKKTADFLSEITEGVATKLQNIIVKAGKSSKSVNAEMFLVITL